MQSKLRRMSKEPTEHPSPLGFSEILARERTSNNQAPNETDNLDHSDPLDEPSKKPVDQTENLTITTDYTAKTILDEFKSLTVKFIDKLTKSLSKEFPASQKKTQERIQKLERRLRLLVRHIFSLPEEILCFERNLEPFREYRVSEVDNDIFTEYELLGNETNQRIKGLLAQKNRLEGQFARELKVIVENSISYPGRSPVNEFEVGFEDKRVPLDVVLTQYFDSQKTFYAQFVQTVELLERNLKACQLDITKRFQSVYEEQMRIEELVEAASGQNGGLLDELLD